jgi:cytoskeletal protein RodZ
MIRNAFIGLSLAGLLSVATAFAEDKPTVNPGAGQGPTDSVTTQVPTMKPEAGSTPNPSATQNPTGAVSTQVPTMKPDASATAPTATDGMANVNCTAAEMTAMKAKAAALTDKSKQKMAMDHLDMAQKSMTDKKMDECVKHLKEASASFGTVTK